LLSAFWSHGGPRPAPLIVAQVAAVEPSSRLPPVSSVARGAPFGSLRYNSRLSGAVFFERLQPRLRVDSPSARSSRQFERLAPATWPNDVPHLSPSACGGGACLRPTERCYSSPRCYFVAGSLRAAPALPSCHGRKKENERRREPEYRADGVQPAPLFNQHTALRARAS
jgi:hypothetical protein